MCQGITLYLLSAIQFIMRIQKAHGSLEARANWHLKMTLSSVSTIDTQAPS